MADGYTSRPCPWCLTDQITVHTERVLSDLWAQAECSECGARGPRSISRDPKKAEREALDKWEDGWEPSESQQGLIPIPKGYAEQ